MALAALEGFIPSYTGDVMELGKHATWHALFFVWKERESDLVMGEVSKRERKTYCMRSYFRVGMGP